MIGGSDADLVLISTLNNEWQLLLVSIQEEINHIEILEVDHEARLLATKARVIEFLKENTCIIVIHTSKRGVYMSNIVNAFDNKATLLHQNNIKMDQLFYHYTKYENLEKILSSKTLRMSDFRYLNDPFEMKFFEEAFREEIKEIAEQEKRFQDEIEEAYDKFGNLIRLSDIYIVSYSKKDYLPSWRWYGDNGFGVSIGFTEEIIGPEKLKSNQSSIKATNIHYGKQLCRKFIKDLSQLLTGFLSKDMSLEEKKNIIILYTFHLYSAMPAYKHTDYKPEQEVRLYREDIKHPNAPPIMRVPENIKSTFPRSVKRQIEDGSLRQENIKVPYIPKNFSANDIKEIWVGPNLAKFEITKRQIEQMLAANGFNPNDIGILHSSCRYRE